MTDDQEFEQTFERDLSAPFTYFGGKSKVADRVWDVFGDINHYIEPFCGSAAVLLKRPSHHIFDSKGGYRNKAETINDFDGLLTNFWRAVKWDPEGLAEECEWPINEIDQNARRDWLQEFEDEISSKMRRSSGESLQTHLREDPDYYDLKAAAWWVWGSCCWIGRKWPESDSDQMPNISSTGEGVHSIGKRDQLMEEFKTLQTRMRHVRVLCGDWSRVFNSRKAYTLKGSGTPVGVFLDPPYPNDSGTEDVYANDDNSVAYEVEQWCKEHQHEEGMRIALCGYEGTYDLPEFEKLEWEAVGGYASQSEGENENAKRERVWFSPNCLTPDKRSPDLLKEEFFSKEEKS